MEPPPRISTPEARRTSLLAIEIGVCQQSSEGGHLVVDSVPAHDELAALALRGRQVCIQTRCGATIDLVQSGGEVVDGYMGRSADVDFADGRLEEEGADGHDSCLSESGGLFLL